MLEQDWQAFYRVLSGTDELGGHNCRGYKQDI